MFAWNLWLTHVTVFILACNYYTHRPLTMPLKKRALCGPVLVNTLGFTAPTCYLYAYWFATLPSRPTSPWVWYIVFYTLVAETAFYWIHRLFHASPFLYRKFHAQHHLWTIPIAPATLDTHPIDHVLINLVPLLAGPCLWPPPTETLLYVWVALSTWHAVYAHAYQVNSRSWAQRLHALHHLTPRFNFGIMGLWDGLMGTLFTGH